MDWSLLFMALFLPLMTGCLIALFTLGGEGIGNPTSWLAKLLGAAAVMVAIVLSWLLSLLLFGLLTRRYLSIGSYERWQLQFENGKTRGSPLITIVGGFALKFVRPKQR